MLKLFLCLGFLFTVLGGYSSSHISDSHGSVSDSHESISHASSSHHEYSSSDSHEHDLTMLHKIKRHGFLMFKGNKLEYDVVFGYWVTQGDMIIGNEKEGAFLHADPNGRRLSPYLVSVSSRWKNGVMPYVIASNLCNNKFLPVFTDVVKRFAQKTGIRLIPTPNTNTNYDHVRFFIGGGCYSTVGNAWGSKRQDISIGNGCIHVGVIIHEILHALGIMHTQTREDRDNYVTIHLQNVRKGMEHNFNKANVNSFDDCLGYDYGSVMHYGSHAFSINGQPTITAKRSGVKLGQRGGFANSDVACVKKMYPGLRVPGSPAGVKCNGNGSPGPAPTIKPVTRPVTRPTTTTGCADKRRTSDCQNFKGRGFCKSSSRYFNYMKAYCKRTCGLCGGGGGGNNCKDNHSGCPGWKNRGFCATNSRYHGYMKANCKKSCGFCRSSAMVAGTILDVPPYYDEAPMDVPVDYVNVGKEIFGLQFAVVTLIVAVTVLLVYVLNLKCRQKKRKLTKYREVTMSDTSESESETPLKKNLK